MKLAIAVLGLMAIPALVEIIYNAIPLWMHTVIGLAFLGLITVGFSLLIIKAVR